MLASELAQELKIDPSVMSKRLSVYFQECGEEKSRILSEQAVQHLRQAHELLISKKALNFTTAVQMVIGTYTEPLPSAVVRRLESRLAHIENVQAQTLESVNRILEYIDTSLPQEVLPEQQDQ